MPSYLDNRLLSSLSPASRDKLLSRCVQVDVALKKSLYNSNTLPAYAYFMTSGVAAITTAMPGGAMVEVGLIGREGMVGGLHLLGPANVGTECFVRLKATALRIPFASLRESFRANEEVRDRLLEFVQAQSCILSQLAACNRLHEADERLARWLLMAQDLTHASVLEFTQEVLAAMLGCRRTTVTVIAGDLQRSGLIEYSRGKVRILDRDRLEAAACGCYAVTRSLNKGLYAPPPSAADLPGSLYPLGQHAAAIYA